MSVDQTPFQILHHLHNKWVDFLWITPFRGGKIWWCALRHLGANLEVCVHRWVALMCESDPPGLLSKKLIKGYSRHARVGIFYWICACIIKFCSVLCPAKMKNLGQNIHFLHRFSVEIPWFGITYGGGGPAPQTKIEHVLCSISKLSTSLKNDMISLKRIV